MNREEIRRQFGEALAPIAPEVDLASIPQDAPLREELDIDSFDFLKLIGAMEQRLGIRIPETDYAKLDTLGHLLDALEQRTAVEAGAHQV